MIYAETTESAMATRFSRPTVNGSKLWRSRYFGPALSPRSHNGLVGSVQPSEGAFVELDKTLPQEPQAFLIEQEPDAIVQTHYHLVDQFQVVVGGGGLIGRHEVRPVAVHFSQAHTGYGPLQPGADGLKYLTLRARPDTSGAHYLPSARERMRPGPRRNVFIEPLAPIPKEVLANLTQSNAITLHMEETGLAVHCLRIAPGQHTESPDPREGDGMSVVVTGGSLNYAGITLRPISCLFASADEASLALLAGPEGAEVIVMRYPKVHHESTVAGANNTLQSQPTPRRAA